MTSDGESPQLDVARAQRLAARWDLSAELPRHQARKACEDWELVLEKGGSEDQPSVILAGFVGPISSCEGSEPGLDHDGSVEIIWRRSC
jgi:hypothetical protein